MKKLMGLFTEEELNSIISRSNDYLIECDNGNGCEDDNLRNSIYILENLMKAAERLKNQMYNAEYVDKE